MVSTMTSKTKKASAALGSAVVLASGSYALGTQTGDGSASADAGRAATSKGASGSASRRDCGVNGLASRLKVDPAKLRQALEAIRSERKADGGPAKELASALGLPEQQVRDALAKLRAQHRGERRDRGPGDVRPGGRRERLSEAAKELGVSKAKLRAALRDARPDSGPGARRGRGPGGPFAADLAKTLGVSADKVEAALAKLQGSRDDHRAEFAKKLADKLGIPESRVKAALPDGPMGVGARRDHHGGPPGGPPFGGRGGGPGFGPPRGGPPPDGPPPGP